MFKNDLKKILNVQNETIAEIDIKSVLNEQKAFDEKFIKIFPEKKFNAFRNEQFTLASLSQLNYKILVYNTAPDTIKPQLLKELKSAAQNALNKIEKWWENA